MKTFGENLGIPHDFISISSCQFVSEKIKKPRVEKNFVTAMWNRWFSLSVRPPPVVWSSEASVINCQSKCQSNNTYVSRTAEAGFYFDMRKNTGHCSLLIERESFM